MRFLTLLRLAPIKVYDHLEPMLMHPALHAMTLVRYAALDYPHPKLSQAPYGRAGRDSLWRRAWGTWQAARRDPPDVIYAIFFSVNGLIALAVARFLGKKCLVSLIGTDLNKHILEYLSGPFLLWALKRVDALTVFDQPAKEKLIARGVRPERIFVMPHAIRLERFPYQPDAPRDIDALFVGMFVPLKEIARLVQAWRGVVDVHPSAKLALVGDGVLRPELEALVDSLNLRPNVLFTGWVDDVPSYLGRARIFVNLSNQEGVPHAMLEAMACGLVPVVTAVGGVPSVIRDGENGLLLPNFPPPASVTAALCRLLAEPALYERLRESALAVRHSHGYAEVSAAWTPVFAFLAK